MSSVDEAAIARATRRTRLGLRIAGVLLVLAGIDVLVLFDAGVAAALLALAGIDLLAVSASERLVLRVAGAVLPSVRSARRQPSPARLPFVTR